MENYKFKYRSRGKFIFVPTERCERKGRRIIKFFDKRVDFPEYFYHYKSGGHVAALHAHLENKLFSKIDIQNFYYSIARMRVTRALRSWGYPGAGTLAKWSCVANPVAANPRHVLPIGFVQSPILASLVLMKSPVSQAIERALTNGVCVSVYLDDFIGSHNDEAALTAAYIDICDTCVSAGLVPNPAKLVAPSAAITAFNCNLTHGSAQVKTDRIDRYLASSSRTPTSDAAFEQYRVLVASANAGATV
jgi:hypothetical protein